MSTLPTICLAGSGGGHLRQLLDLEPVWGRYPYFFITEPTALGESLAKKHPVEFVAHYSFGQTRLGNPLAMLRGAWRNFSDSLAALKSGRPDVLVTTGAGAVFLPAVLAKLRGTKIIAIESFARFQHPSLFGRMIARFADVMVIQSPALAENYPKALVFDPFRRLTKARPKKEQLIFATVGATLPYPRLSEAVAALKRSGRIKHRVVLQTGVGGRVPGEDPEGLTQVETLPFEEITALLRDADIVITHGGTGSLITALREGCHVIAMPRRFSLGEHYDDHQEQIVKAFVARGLLQEADAADDIMDAIDKTGTIDAPLATTDPSELIVWLNSYLEGLPAKKAA